MSQLLHLIYVSSTRWRVEVCEDKSVIESRIQSIKPWIITFLVPLLLATPKLALNTHFCTAHRRKHVIPIFCVGGHFCQHLHARLSRSEEDLEKVTVRSEISTW